MGNEEALEELAWTLAASGGEFQLILARCNYLRLRSHIVTCLQKFTDLDIHILNLKRCDKTLYAKIHAEIQNKQPNALMVFGLESVDDLDHILNATNQVREEFRKNFHFPLVLWVTDEVLPQLVRLASDFESWGTSIQFTLAKEELIQSIKEDTDALFNVALSSDAYCIGWQMGYLRRWEIAHGFTDLHNKGETLEASIEASVKFVLGQDAYLKNQIDTALAYYQESLAFWLQYSDPPLRAGVVMFYIGLCYLHLAELKQVQFRENLKLAQSYFQSCLDIFTQADTLNLIAKFINPLGEVLQRLEAWDQLENLAQKSLNLQQLYGNSLRVAQSYGFLAEVALNKGNWQQAKQNAYKALHNTSKNKVSQPQYRSLYLLLLAQAERELGQLQHAVKHLQIARNCGSQENPHQYIRILQALRSLYWEQKLYLQAFSIKLEQLSVEQQYGFRAFIGAGKIQPQRQVKLALTQFLETLPVNFFPVKAAPEITVSSRGQDVERLLERIARPDYKLIVIYGYAGVGKSSLVEAGLLPALKHKAIGIQDVVPVFMGVYANWVGELGKLVKEAVTEIGIEIGNEFPHLQSPINVLEILQHSESLNLRIILIFDQLEELFFVHKSPTQRQRFFEFLAECLNILGVKVILSLRQDYLHHLLEYNYLPNMNIINNDILSQNILYQVSSFTRNDAKLLIYRLTKHSHFYLEDVLIEKLVDDLAANYGEVHPVELQVVGARLQTENITTLATYEKLGSKKELIKRYLQEVIEDCGEENNEIATLVIYLFTDEKGNRLVKTRLELERDLQLVNTFHMTTKQLDLVLQIFIAAGIIVLLPEYRDANYQLIHDHLAVFVHHQSEPQLNDVKLNQQYISKKQFNIENKLLAIIMVLYGFFLFVVTILFLI